MNSGALFSCKKEDTQGTAANLLNSRDAKGSQFNLEGMKQKLSGEGGIPMQ